MRATHPLPVGYEVRLSLRVLRVAIEEQHEIWYERPERVIRIQAEVPDRDTKETKLLEFRHPVFSEMPVPLAIREALRAFMFHEVDEAITVYGERPFDPHKDEKR